MNSRSKIASEAFVDKANKVHDSKYDYSLVNYTRARDKVIIICPVHGQFVKTPNKHLNGQGCPECSNESVRMSKLKTFKDFVEQANKIHLSKYYYIESTYSGSKPNMQIVCPIHGEFTQTPDHHVNRGQGCPECAKIQNVLNSTKTTEKFIEDSVSKHGFTYSYEKVNYVSSHKNVTIVCSKHGDFEQSPSNHLAGKGCSKCSAGGGFDGKKSGLMYYLSIDNGKYYKIGITNRTVSERFSKDELKRITIIKQWDYAIGYEAAAAESNIKKLHADSLIDSTIKVLRNGNTEIFSKDVLGLDE